MHIFFNGNVLRQTLMLIITNMLNITSNNQTTHSIQYVYTCKYTVWIIYLHS